MKVFGVPMVTGLIMLLIGYVVAKKTSFNLPLIG